VIQELYGADAPIKVHTIRATGTVYVYGPEIDVIDTREFQRLGAIKQLGTSYLVFRGAMHTRFEHSLGTLQQAQNIVDRVNANPRSDRKIGVSDLRVIRLAALLHDLPHIPFGHTLEDEFGLLDRHDQNPKRIQSLLVESRIGEILRDALSDDEYSVLLRVLEAHEPPEADAGLPKDELLVRDLGDRAYIADIVANTVCADVLDYIVRDLSACGMPVAIGDRFLDFFAITPGNAPVPVNRNRMALRLDKRGMPRPDVESEIIKLLTYRYELAERVFFHHAKNAASVMIGRAVALLGLDEHDENFHWLGDDLLLAVLANPDLAEPLQLKITSDDGRRAEAAELGRRFFAGRALYKLAYLGVRDEDVGVRAHDVYQRWGEDPAARAGLEAELAAKAGLEPGRVLVHLPDPKMMAKLAKVRILLEGGTVITFEDWEEQHAGRVQALNAAHERLWRVAVYVHPDDAEDKGKRRLLGTAARELFGMRSRYAEPEPDEPYLAAVFDLFVEDEDWPAGRREDVIQAASEAAAAANAPDSLDAARDLVRQIVDTGFRSRDVGKQETMLDDGT
jgi:HD superfamily phosphohydrolase